MQLTRQRSGRAMQREIRYFDREPKAYFKLCLSSGNEQPSEKYADHVFRIRKGSDWEKLGFNPYTYGVNSDCDGGFLPSEECDVISVLVETPFLGNASDLVSNIPPLNELIGQENAEFNTIDIVLDDVEFRIRCESDQFSSWGGAALYEDEGNAYEFEGRVESMDEGWGTAIRKNLRHLQQPHEIIAAIKWGLPREQCYGLKSGFSLSFALYHMHKSSREYEQAVFYAQEALMKAPRHARSRIVGDIFKLRVKAGEIEAIHDAMAHYANDMQHIISYTEDWIDLAIKADDYRFVMDIVTYVNARMLLCISGQVVSKLLDQPHCDTASMKKDLQYFLTRLSSKRGILVDKLVLQNTDRLDELSGILDLLDRHKKNAGASIQKMRKMIDIAT